MVIFPSGFALSEAAASVSLAHARIGYQNWAEDLDSTYVTVSSEEEDGPRDAPLRPDTWEFWQPTALPATWELDLGQARDFDYIGIAGHTLGSCGASILVETSDGSLGGSPEEQVWETFSAEVNPGTDAPLMFLDDSVFKRYVRLTIEGVGDIPVIGVVYVGEVLKMQRSIYGGHSPMNLSRETELHRALSRRGKFLGQGFRSHGTVGDASFRHLTPDWYRENFDPFVKHARSKPFFFAWRPEDYPNEVAYALCPSDISPSNMGVHNFMEVSFRMRGEGHE